MIFKNFIAIISLLVTSLVFSQGETNNWFFGRYCGVNFNSGNAVAVNDGRILTEVGCATISSASGDLLVYTTGD